MAENIEVERDIPFPPRFRSLKRWSVIGALTVLMLIGLRIWWGREAHRRMDALINEAHAQGRKILVSDFAAPPVDQDRNAAAVLITAATSIRETKEQSEWEFDHELPLTTTDVVIIRGLMTSNRAVLAQARTARKLDQVDWGVRPRTPVMNVMLPHLSQVRRLSNLTQEVGFYQHTQGSDGEAIEGARDILFQAWCLDREPSWLITHLVAAGLSAQAAQLVYEISPDLKISESAASAKEDQAPAATRDQVRALIDQFRDDSDMQRGMRQCWQGEQLGVLDNIPFFAKQQLGRPVWVVFEPMFELDAVRGARNLEAFANALEQPNYVACVRAAPRMTAPDYPMMLLSTRAMSRYLVATPSSTLLRRHWTIIAERRMAAIALSLRLYALDHGGRLPKTLDELVPDYIAKLPSDPFTEGQRFIYRPGGKDPVIYSVGVNGVDDTGDSSVKGNPAPDIVISLKPRQHITTAPAAEPSE